LRLVQALSRKLIAGPTGSAITPRS
jgi:hypothetical protein